MNCYDAIEQSPENVLRANKELALLFKRLATLRTAAPLPDVETAPLARGDGLFREWQWQSA